MQLYIMGETQEKQAWVLDSETQWFLSQWDHYDFLKYTREPKYELGHLEGPEGVSAHIQNLHIFLTWLFYIQTLYILILTWV